MSEEQKNIETGAEQTGGTGAIIGVVIIVLVLILGAWYIIGNRIEKINTPVTPESEVAEITTGTSTELEDIQTDLDSVNFEALDQE